jgi:dienelactone hydrolase
MNSLHMLIVLSIVIPLPQASAQSSGDQPPVRYIEREFYVPYPPAGPHGMDAVEVWADLPGKHPLALLTHGTAANPSDLALVTPWSYLSQALWFARRGYVALVIVRRGYGRSGGEPDGRGGGCGSNGSFKQAAELGVEDLQAAARYAVTLPEVDAGTVISTGVSSGGLAQVALATKPVPGLKTTISFAGGRGGDGKGNNCNLSGLVGTFHDFGKHNKVPMLWIYSENDKWFPPEMARHFQEAFLKGGGTDEFVMTPPDGEDGHNLFSHTAKWTPTVEEHLRKLGLLPLGDKVLPPPVAENEPLPAGLSETGARAFRQFLTAGPFKAFAAKGADSWGMSTAQFTQEIANKDALEHCKTAAHGAGACQLVQTGPR